MVTAGIDYVLQRSLADHWKGKCSHCSFATAWRGHIGHAELAVREHISAKHGANK